MTIAYVNTRYLLKLRNVEALIHHPETIVQHSIKEILKVISHNAFRFRLCKIFESI